MNIVEILRERARSRPGAPAIIEARRGRDRTVSFADLDRRSAKIASLLGKTGIGPGDRVLVFHPMSADLYTVLIGLFRIGAAAMLIDPSAGREHIDRCVEAGSPAGFIGGPRAHLLRIVSGAIRRIPGKFVIGPRLPGAVPLGAAAGEADLDAPTHCGEEMPALLTFTSGSTGIPKATVRTHRFLLAQHRVLERSFGLVEGEVDLATLPVFVLANLASGVTTVVPDADLRAPGAVAPGPILSQVRRLGVTRCAASPALLERLVEAPGRDRAALGGLRKVFAGGAPVFPRLLDRLAGAAPAARVEAVYGSTEAEPIARLDAREIGAADRSSMRAGGGLLAGSVVPEIRLRIIRDLWGKPVGPLGAAELDRLVLPAGEAGEIVVAGDHVLKGYLDGRGDEETKIVAGGEVWHRTGDAGRIDGQGRLWLLGRCSARIRDGRGDVDPFSVECVAMERPEIRRAACIGIEGRRLLAIEASPALDAGGRRALAEELRWAGLDEIREVPRLPVDRRHNAKIDYPALRKLLGRAT